MFHEALLLLRRAGREKARTLQARLFLFFLLFAVALVGAGFLILTLAGVFNAAADRHITWLDTESEHLQANVSGDFNELSLRGAALAGTISSNISRWSERNGITESEITQSVPALTDSLSRRELIENLLSEQAGILLSTLNNNVCSGVFIILDDAVHLSGDNPSGTRAGIYFKRTATSNVSALSSKIYCLRGPAPIAGPIKPNYWDSGARSTPQATLIFLERRLTPPGRTAGRIFRACITGANDICWKTTANIVSAYASRLSRATEPYTDFAAWK